LLCCKKLIYFGAYHNSVTFWLDNLLVDGRQVVAVVSVHGRHLQPNYPAEIRVNTVHDTVVIVVVRSSYEVIL